MRLTSDFWTAALMHRARVEGGFAYLTRRGSNDAGAIFILLHLSDGKTDLYGPAPQSFYVTDGGRDERCFIKILSQVEEQVAVEKLEKELEFDADLWLIEIENYQSEELPFPVVEP
ncbi:DUF1491 family protein [uncultured Bartonella sp.]|uniref:DUF1491 family protein n=1 Tax=uncultured Bartonella sp. TaxID=104108 RepID=UPI0026235CCF|nr:DUF1491 family protein [uncultured Bartonella sp.]